MRRLATYLALLTILSTGCDSGPAPPEVYPAGGRVLGVDGSPAKGGMVEFRQTEAPYVVATGSIGQDGTFTLGSIFEERRLAGVPEGTYLVTVLPDFSESAQGQHLIQAAVLPKPLSISSASENVFEIDVREANR